MKSYLMLQNAWFISLSFSKLLRESQQWEWGEKKYPTQIKIKDQNAW